MKIKLLLALFCIFAFSFAAFSQSVIVTPQKITYKRPKPLMDSKKDFSIVRPKVRGANPATAKKIETTISYEKAFDFFNLKDEIGEFQWLEEASYTVDYNKNDILVVTLSMLGSAAYPSEVSQPVVVNLKTGDKVSAKDVFVKLSELAAKGKQTQETEIKKAIVEIKKENPEENPASLFENADFTVENLDKFSVSDQGITFWYDYGFPHVILALQPEGRFFFSWAELKLFIKPDGLLARFNR